MQLLWMDLSVARSYYYRYVEPALVESCSVPNIRPQLERLAIERENYHSRLVTYTVRLVSSSSTSSNQNTVPRLYEIPQVQIELTNTGKNDSSYSSNNFDDNVAERMATLTAALARTRDNKNTPNSIIAPTTCFDFWQTEAWWRDHVSAYWFEHPARQNSRRITHLLNQLMRVLRQQYRRDVATALLVLRALQPRQIDLLDRVFVEPINGSLIASHLSTIFMHNKQQTGLNMKHEANKLFTLSTRNLQSDRDFDAKIYLKMCTSCVGREIFELMVMVRLSKHNGCKDDDDDKNHRQDNEDHHDNNEDHHDDDCTTLDDSSARQRRDYIFCRCANCQKLRSFANAWRYYDCSDNVWVRFEFPRKAYQAVTEVLLFETAQDAMQLVYSSDKNEFHDKQLFVDNFVNYYVFYENDQHPLVVGQCTGNMRNTVSVLFVFAIINWVMIVDSRERKSNNSISLNQQSLCKSLGNTVYSIFSENCINRVQCEKTRRVIRENSAYINRGLGMVPNTGINAFHTTHRWIM